MKKVDEEGNCYFEYLNYMNSLNKKDLLEYAIGADLLSDRLQERINKAIEYMKKCNVRSMRLTEDNYLIDDLEILENILKGEDKK